MKTKRRHLRWLKRHTQKLLKGKQRGGIRLLSALGLGAAVAAAASSGQPVMPNPGTAPSTAVMPHGQFYGSPMPSPSFNSSLMSYGNSFAAPSYKGSPSYFSTNTGTHLTMPELSATPSHYITPPARPGAIASVVAPVHKILQDVGVDFLKGTLGPVTKEMVTEALFPKKLSEGIVIGGHNTLTTSTSRLPILGTPLVSVNQMLTLDQQLDRCAATGRCLIDLDMWMVDGTVKSTHGGPVKIKGVRTYLEKVIDTSEGSGGTQPVLQKIHAFAKSHPDTIFMIRSENHDVSAKDITSMLTPEMKSHVASFSKFDVPTQGELVERGTNVMYFLENNDQAAVDQSTGIYIGSIVMAQEHFVIRTNYNDVKGLTSTDDMNEHMIYDPTLIGSNPIILIDGYNTLIAANTSPQAFDSQTQFVSQVVTDILPRMKAAAKAHGVQNVDDAGCIIMMDFVNDGSYAYQVSLNLKDTIKDPEVKKMVEQEIIPAFVKTQEMIAPTVTGASQRGFANSFYATYEGKPLSSVNKGRVGGAGAAIGGMTLVLFYFLFGRKKKLAEKSGDTDLVEKMNTELKSDIEANPEIAVFIQKGEESVKESDTNLLNDNPSTWIQSFSLPNSPKNEPITPGSNNTMPLFEADFEMSKTQKKKLKKQAQRSRKENNAFLKWGQRPKRGGKTRRH